MTVTTPRSARLALRLDQIEKYVLAALFVFFAWRMITAYLATGSVVTLLYLLDQLTVLVFVLLRRPSAEVSLRIDDWVVGFAGTFLALLIGPPSGAPLVPPFVVTGLLLAGFALHFSAKLSLRRSFGVVAANRGVKAAGAYRLVRHPMYLGYVISHTGLLLAGPTLANIVVIGICWALYVLRILAEERVLLRDPAYRAFATRRRWRLIPFVF